MSWLFGRGRDDDEYTDDDEGYTSSGEDEDDEDDDEEYEDDDDEEDEPVKTEPESPIETLSEDASQGKENLATNVVQVDNSKIPADDNGKEKENVQSVEESEGNRSGKLSVPASGDKRDDNNESVTEEETLAPPPPTTSDNNQKKGNGQEMVTTDPQPETVPAGEAAECIPETQENSIEMENEEVATKNPDSDDKDEENGEENETTEATAAPEEIHDIVPDPVETPTKQKSRELEEVEEVTSTHEKRSLLVLAAEHDRVDILKAILADDSEDRDTLLNSGIPPLHISISYGSTNAVQCLLRMGADPSVRPDVEKIKEEADGEGEEKLVEIPNMGRFDGLSAWELAFGKEGDENKQYGGASKKRGGWFGGGDSGKKTSSIDIAPSKLEGIRHAFTAEALRCIGSDEADRLKQLLDSGMPTTIDIGGKNLYDWSVEMGALQCEELLRPAEAIRNGNAEGDDPKTDYTTTKLGNSSETGSTIVLDRSTPGEESLSQLNNRIDELESLSKALSTCLDNLAEEVSVCHGLLLMGGGATALASHVRSLKALKESKTAELQRMEEAWENSEDELAYWAKECGEEGKEIAELMSTAIISSAEKQMNASFNGTPEDEQAQKQQLKAQAAALENKIRKLRASITDLSEESTRDLEEVEKRGLSGGIKLVRTLREELREIEFTLNETKSAEALCRAKIKVIQSKLGAKRQPNVAMSEGEPASKRNGTSPSQDPSSWAQAGPVETTATTPSAVDEPSRGSEPPARTMNGDATHQSTAASEVPNPRPPRASETASSVSSGQSSAVALKKSNTHGYFTVDLWEILLRIIGLGSSSRQSYSSPSSASNVMIV